MDGANEAELNSREEKSIKEMKQKVERLKHLLATKATVQAKKKQKRQNKKGGKRSILKKKGAPRTAQFHQLRNGKSTKKMNQIALSTKTKESIPKDSERNLFENESELLKSSKKGLNVQEIRMEIEEGDGAHLTRRDLLMMNQELIKQLKQESERKLGGTVAEMQRKLRQATSEKEALAKREMRIQNELFGKDDLIQRLISQNEQLRTQLAQKQKKEQEVAGEREELRGRAEQWAQENLVLSKKLGALEKVVEELEDRRDKLRKTLKKGVDKQEDVWERNFQLEETNLRLKRQNKVLGEENLEMQARLREKEEELREKQKQVEKEKTRKEILELRMVRITRTFSKKRTGKKVK